MSRCWLIWLLAATTLVASNAHASVSCSDVAELDKSEDLRGALVLLVGCKPVSADILFENWQNIPKSARPLFTDFYMVPGTTHTGATDPRLTELIGDGSTIFQRLLASTYRYDTPDLQVLWTSLAGKFDQISDVEKIYHSVNQYYYSPNYSTEIEAEPWLLSPAELTLKLVNSEVPLFAVLYANMLQDGEFVTGTEDQFLAIYDQHKPNFPDSAFLKAIYLYSKIRDGNLAYRQYSGEIIELLEFSISRGSHIAKKWMAEALMAGDLVEADPIKATQIYQSLAQFGWPDSQIDFGKQLIEGRGIAVNVDAGWDWIRVAATQQDPRAYNLLFEKALEDVDFVNAVYWAMKNAEHGYVSFSDKGYVAAKALLSNLELSPSDLKLLSDYLRFHCETSTHVYDNEDCTKLGGEVREFRSRPSLIEASKNPSLLRLADEFELDTGRYIALIVANDEYEIWDSLETPRRDAELVGSILESQYGFEVTYLKNASRRDTLRALYDMGSDIQFNDHFLLYYAGHGVVDRATDTAYWIPSNASRDFRPDWISSAEIMTSLKAIPSRHLLLVADSCYSGKLLRGAAPTEGNPGVAVIQRLFSKKARVAITSGGDEPVQDASSGGQHSVFANAFARALSDADGPTPSSTIFNNVLGVVSLEASQTPQYADMRELGHDGGDFIFVPGAGQ